MSLEETGEMNGRVRVDELLRGLATFFKKVISLLDFQPTGLLLEVEDQNDGKQAQNDGQDHEEHEVRVELLSDDWNIGEEVDQDAFVDLRHVWKAVEKPTKSLHLQESIVQAMKRNECE